MASEIDLPWTYLGGSARLIETVLADPHLEAMPAEPEDPIQFRVQGWLDTLIADAAVELLERGTVTVTTSRGSVHATLNHPISSGNSRSWLLISHDAAHSRGSGGVPLISESENTLLDVLRRTLGLEVTNLVNN